MDDVNGDNLLEIAVATISSLHILNGSNGAILLENENCGTYFRDIRSYPDITEDGIMEVITGNSQDDILVWDIAPSSATFGDFVANTSFGCRVNSLLKIEDLDGDGINEYAVGGNGKLGVVLGANLTVYWSASATSSLFMNFPAVNIYDIAIMDDLNNDGHRDIAFTGGGNSFGDGAMFIYDADGVNQFWPYYTGTDTTDSTTTTPTDTGGNGGLSGIPGYNIAMIISLSSICLFLITKKRK